MSGMMDHVFYMLSLSDGDVVVRTSWWRRWRGTEEWGIVRKRLHPRPRTSAYVVGPSGDIMRLQGTKVCNDPERWPDDVCAAVAKYRMTGEVE
jgi:hypothetical protein